MEKNKRDLVDCRSRGERHIAEWLYARYAENGVLQHTTRRIADATGQSIYQATGYLQNLQAKGLVNRTPPARGKPVLWTLIKE